MIPGASLRALLVEDVEHDALLIVRELRRGFDLTWERVDTAEAMERALGSGPWDVIIADCTMPRFSAGAALALVKARRLDLPFIIVSGSVNEDVAVEIIRAGAHDFLAKSNLARLNPAIERELREASVRRERAAMQEQLLVSNRMASMGMLAAGVAHEINNPLAALMANLEFASDELTSLVRDLRALETGRTVAPGAGTVSERLRDIQEPLTDASESAERVRRIVRDLKMFSRSDDDHVAKVDLHRVIESSLRMAWNEIRHRARLVKDYGSPPTVDGIEGRLGQVFLNLFVNAAQAIPEGMAAQNEIRIVTRRNERGQAVVEVRDTGSGMPPEIVRRAFDPFFTTKAPDEGTGLGLPICHRIVTDLGGEIEIESEVERGTVVRLVLPASTMEAPRRASSQKILATVRRGHVLVVDDEPSLGVAVARMLSHDHQVVVTISAEDALARVKEGERFDVILCDLMMPDLTGMDLHAQILRVDARQADRIVFMTGGAFTPFARDYLNNVSNLSIEKPFDTIGLRAAVQSVLAWP